MTLYDSDASEEYLLDGRYVIKPLVRCKDCKNRYTDSCGMFDIEAEWEWTEDNGFCQYGERREG